MNNKRDANLFLLVQPLLLLALLPTFSFCSQNHAGRSLEQWTQKRAMMVRILKRYGIKDQRVLAAMAKVRRHLFIPISYRNRCNPYGDHPCPIGYGQTISQPYIVAYMTEKLQLKKGEKVLEIGTGSGYQAAILAEMGVQVFSVELVSQLAKHARAILDAEGYQAVKTRHSDGYLGWMEFAPYDAIIGTCAPQKIPASLKAQLRDGGRMILPVGGTWQRLVIVRNHQGTFRIDKDLNVRFVPMVKKKK
jgi:protein-L-isoaspartate(D-aspartate) O-methyltransferase